MIDAASNVVRMWNWHWQDPSDYGLRYDWGIVEAHSRVLSHWQRHNQHHPSKGWLCSLLSAEQDLAMRYPEDALLIDQREFFLELPDHLWGCGETGGWQLTRGGVAACWALSNAAKGDAVILVGFDTIKAGIAPEVDEAFSQEYMDSPGFFGMGSFAPGKTKEGNHDYSAECRMIRWMAGKAGVRVNFAEDIWPIRNRRKPKFKIVSEGNESMKFVYCGNYPASGVVTCWGVEFNRNVPTELEEPWASKARLNRFFMEVEQPQADPEDEPRNQLLVADGGPDKAAFISEAEALGVKIDKRWSVEKIAAAIKAHYAAEVE